MITTSEDWSVNEIKHEVNKKYGMFVMGVPEDHFAAPLLRGLPSIHFDTLLYEIQFPHSVQTCKKVDTQRLSPECGML